jgi:hypothetical protein
MDLHMQAGSQEPTQWKAPSKIFATHCYSCDDVDPTLPFRTPETMESVIADTLIKLAHIAQAGRGLTKSPPSSPEPASASTAARQDRSR